jgi:uncharacterized protein YfcZ (UPF0381/DUF406 family)
MAFKENACFLDEVRECYLIIDNQKETADYRIILTTEHRADPRMKQGPHHASAISSALDTGNITMPKILATHCKEKVELIPDLNTI